MPSIGATVRRLFGPLEPTVSEFYRGLFVDLDEFARAIKSWVPDAHRILEVGCGEGAMTERLVLHYPEAEILGIDISPRLGRLYRGPRRLVKFQQRTVDDIVGEAPQHFDLVVLADVMHHVQPEIRPEFFQSVEAALLPGGHLVFKDWERSISPQHAICFFMERYITGDTVQYCDLSELKSFSHLALANDRRIGPWRNNLALHYRAP